MYDVKKFLRDNAIYFKSSGTNVSTGWIEIRCPFPMCNDPSEHMGINLSSSMYNCWKCGEHGPFTKLVKVLLNIGWKNAEDLASEYFKPSLATKYKHEETPHKASLHFPKEATSKLPDLHKDYLRNRNFDPKQIRKDYDIMACYQTGNYAYRIIIPIFMFGKPVSFTARDVTDEQETRYKNMPNEKSVIPVKQCLYNIDNAGDTLLIVEGPLDVWRMGKGAIATMGTKITNTQIKIIIDRKPKRVFVLYDWGAYSEAYKLAHTLSPYVEHGVETLTIDVKDPAELTEKDAKLLRKEIGL